MASYDFYELFNLNVYSCEEKDLEVLSDQSEIIVIHDSLRLSSNRGGSFALRYIEGNCSVSIFTEIHFLQIPELLFLVHLPRPGFPEGKTEPSVVWLEKEMSSKSSSSMLFLESETRADLSRLPSPSSQITLPLHFWEQPGTRNKSLWYRKNKIRFNNSDGIPL